MADWRSRPLRRSRTQTCPLSARDSPRRKTRRRPSGDHAALSSDRFGVVVRGRGLRPSTPIVHRSVEPFAVKNVKTNWWPSGEKSGKVAYPPSRVLVPGSRPRTPLGSRKGTAGRRELAGQAARWAAAAAEVTSVDFEVAARDQLHRQRVRPDLLFRLPARRGRPVGALRRARVALADDGVVLVEPQAGDLVADILKPGRSALLHSIDAGLHPELAIQEVGLPRGAQAGPTRLAELATEAGFGTVRVATWNPFDQVVELRSWPTARNCGELLGMGAAHRVSAELKLTRFGDRNVDRLRRLESDHCRSRGVINAAGRSGRSRAQSARRPLM